MCTNTRLVLNKYTRKMVRVSCGKCPACLQEKAVARTNRIRNHVKLGYISLFVTLTYSNDFLPYVLRSNLLSSNDVTVFRRKSVRTFRGRDIISDCVHELETIHLLPEDFDGVDLSTCMCPVRFPDPDAIGVPYYKDLQNFIKRLRINLKRNYNYVHEISYYACTELGPTTQRPHMHLLIFVPKDDAETVSAAIVASWPFGDKERTGRFVQIAKDAASYVSSYLNRSTGAPDISQICAFSPKHSYSKNFGASLHAFSLPVLLEKIERGSLVYHVKTVRDGVESISSLPYPRYIVSRYFPKFKGYFLFNDDEIRKHLLTPGFLAILTETRNPALIWSYDDYYRFTIRLRNIASKFMCVFHWSYEEFEAIYPHIYVSAWNVLSSTCLRLSYDNITNNAFWLSFYENLNEVSLGSDSFDDFEEFILKLGFCLDDLVIDPNSRLDVVNKTANMEQLYYKMDKSRKIVNKVLSSIGLDF